MLIDFKSVLVAVAKKKIEEPLSRIAKNVAINSQSGKLCDDSHLAMSTVNQRAAGNHAHIKPG